VSRKKGVCMKGHDLRVHGYNRPDGTNACKTCANAKRRNGTRLDARPFAEWLQENRPDELRPAALAFMNDYRPRTFHAWAHSLGIDPQQARRLMSGEHKSVDVRIVDRVLLEAGVPWMLQELYPLKEVA
jgi:hypothetical protein